LWLVEAFSGGKKCIRIVIQGEPLSLVGIDPVKSGPEKGETSRPVYISLSRRWKDKGLAWMNQIRIADLLSVRLVNDGIACAHTMALQMLFT
jgi:hypothetical protein